MKKALTLVLLAFAATSFADTIHLKYASDGTPGMVLPKEALRAPAGWREGVGRLREGAAARALPFLFDYTMVPVAVKALEIAPASKELLQVSLPERLDTTQRIQDMFWQFNKRNYFTSTAFDRSNKVYFAFFTGKAGEEVCEPEGGRLLKSSIPVDLDAETHYVISLQINIFDPEKSYLLYNPARGFAGKQNKVRADKAMGYIHNAGVVVPFSKGPLTFFYATDVDAATKKLAATRTVSFVKEDGRDTKYYTIHEEDLPKEKWVSADLGGQPALLFRTQADALIVSEPN